MESEPEPPLNADAILRALIAGEVDFLVIGALAVAAHGYPRATKDVDIVPQADSENAVRLVAALTGIGARPIETDDFRPEELPVAFGVEGLALGGNWALRTEHGRIDVMQWIAGVHGYEQLDANAFVVDVPNVGRLKFAGLDDLVAMKRAAGRPQDVVDLERLAEAAG